MTQEFDATTERKLWFSGAWGRSLPTSFLQFGPDCIACHYYPQNRVNGLFAEFLFTDKARDRCVNQADAFGNDDPACSGIGAGYNQTKN